MYNNQLDIFIAVANYKSFSKAAEILFISPTAVMKQMNNLENRIGIKLIERSSHGISLTNSGEEFYKASKFIIKYSADTLNKIKQKENTEKCIIRIGTSVLNPCKVLMDLWGKVNNIYTQFKISIVPFDDDHKNILNVINNIGKNFDFIIGACDSPQWLSRCNFFKLGEYNECIAVPRNHPLSKKKLLQIEDLYGEKLFLVKKGVSLTLDRLHDELEKKHPQIQLEDTSFYDIQVFNACEQNGNIMLTLDAWADVHPSFVTIPIGWNYKIPYGILYSITPSKDVKEFLNIIKKVQL